MTGYPIRDMYAHRITCQPFSKARSPGWSHQLLGGPKSHQVPSPHDPPLRGVLPQAALGARVGRPLRVACSGGRW